MWLIVFPPGSGEKILVSKMTNRPSQLLFYGQSWKGNNQTFDAHIRRWRIASDWQCFHIFPGTQEAQVRKQSAAGPNELQGFSILSRKWQHNERTRTHTHTRTAANNWVCNYSLLRVTWPMPRWEPEALLHEVTALMFRGGGGGTCQEANDNWERADLSQVWTLSLKLKKKNNNFKVAADSSPNSDVSKKVQLWTNLDK